MAKQWTWETTTRVYDPKARTWKHHKIQIAVDWQRLADALGAKAARNKSGVSKLALGITAKLTGAPKP